MIQEHTTMHGSYHHTNIISNQTYCEQTQHNIYHAAATYLITRDDSELKRAVYAKCGGVSIKVN